MKKKKKASKKKTKLVKKPIEKKKKNLAKETKVIDHGYGRPKILTTEDKQVALALAEQGFPEYRIAERLGVDWTTIWRLKSADLKFCKALKIAKKLSCDTVARSMYENANGYSCPEIKIVIVDKAIHKIKVIKHYPPNVEAGKFYLKNKDSDNWKDKLEAEIATEGKSMAELIMLASVARKKKNG